MKLSAFFQRSIIVLGFAAAAIAPAQAQGNGKQGMDYSAMCVQSANMPKPYGEYDLKGNAKLPDYCKCFSEAFGARAMKAMSAMQAGGKPPSLEQSNKEELELRNVCRKKVGLPLAVEAK
ncbi:hypothetical protein [Massilia sp. CF038]|uniref:hypothetical protein n=1 Tax=Massilia sp. CF038 TaxID=1881045 RepID=UPI00090F1B37|nr:hypothetical protein [Massilia sp. CF038]SHH59847.1 hypothetical protein SAMN05428948_4544 [Massilia sp. CF038]